MIVHAEEPITLIGGAPTQRQTFLAVQKLAPRLIAADSGADQAIGFGAMPEAVIGDLDSMSAAARATLSPETLHPIADQDTTDFDKCLRNIAAPLVIGVGFSGARMDHQLAVCNTLVRHPDRRCILVGADDLVLLLPPVLHLDLTEGCRVSLFPLGAVEGVSDGLRWPIDGLTFTPDGTVGTSNQALGPVELAVTTPKMLLLLPVACLPEVTRAMMAAHRRW